jgi:hypothetical protein
MLRTGLRLSVVVGLAAAIAVIIYQQARIDRLAAEAALLREQVRPQAPFRDERNEGAKPEPSDESRSNSVGSLTGEQSQEMLRLRGEVGVLRRQLAEALAQAKEPAKQQPSPQQTGSWTEADLNDEQRKSLAQWTSKLKTGNSVADLARLKDSLERWDELFMNPAPVEQKPVFAILKERLKERIAELEEKK